jgi:hypothetical protein
VWGFARSGDFGWQRGLPLDEEDSTVDLVMMVVAGKIREDLMGRRANR